MAFCAQCGAQFEGKFCGKCGAPASGGGQTPPAQPQAEGGGLTANMAGALAYLLGPITGILFLTLEPHNKNREVRFHAWQSIFFWIALVVVYIVEAMLMSIMPTFITILIGFAWLLIGLGSMAVWLFLMIRAYNGQKWVLPIVGPLAEKQA